MYNRYDAELRPCHKLQEVFVEGAASGAVSQAPEPPACVDDVSTVQDYRVIRIARYVFLLEIAQMPIESQVIGALEHTPK